VGIRRWCDIRGLSQGPRLSSRLGTHAARIPPPSGSAPVPRRQASSFGEIGFSGTLANPATATQLSSATTAGPARLCPDAHAVPYRAPIGRLSWTPSKPWFRCWQAHSDICTLFHQPVGWMITLVLDHSDEYHTRALRPPQCHPLTDPCWHHRAVPERATLSRRYHR